VKYLPPTTWLAVDFAMKYFFQHFLKELIFSGFGNEISFSPHSQKNNFSVDLAMK
jgi:hypothetical protein